MYYKYNLITYINLVFHPIICILIYLTNINIYFMLLEYYYFVLY